MFNRHAQARLGDQFSSVTHQTNFLVAFYNGYSGIAVDYVQIETKFVARHTIFIVDDVQESFVLVAWTCPLRFSWQLAGGFKQFKITKASPYFFFFFLSKLHYTYLCMISKVLIKECLHSPWTILQKRNKVQKKAKNCSVLIVIELS